MLSINEAKNKNDSNSKEKININEKTHFLVSNAIAYSLSKYVRAYAKLLVNRGDNGGVVEGWTRIIFTNLSRKVSIHSINNHKIDSILIVLSSRVVKTICRQAIVIFNQCVYHRKGTLQGKLRILRA